MQRKAKKNVKRLEEQLQQQEEMEKLLTDENNPSDDGASTDSGKGIA